MRKKKILIPIDSTEKSLIAIEYLKENYNKEDILVNLIYVGEVVFVNGMFIPIKVTDPKKMGKNILKNAMTLLEGYSVESKLLYGRAGDEILSYAEENNIDKIIMAKNTKKKLALIVGSVTAYVAKKTKCILTIVPEKD